MTGRIIAWTLLFGVCFAGYQGVKHFKNPWAISASPAAAITAVMPPMTSCDKDCTK